MAGTLLSGAHEGPLIVHAPGLAPGHREALTTAADLTPAILELNGEERPSAMQGVPFLNVLVGSKDEHRPFVVSSWPLYVVEGEITTAADSRPQRISSYMPLTITTRDRSVILGGSDDKLELYELATDPREQTNAWGDSVHEIKSICEDAILFLEGQGTPGSLLAPRRKALESSVSSG